VYEALLPLPLPLMLMLMLMLMQQLACAPAAAPTGHVWLPDGAAGWPARGALAGCSWAAMVVLLREAGRAGLAAAVAIRGWARVARVAA
jgi:hypothetical protein